MTLTLERCLYIIMGGGDQNSLFVMKIVTGKKWKDCLFAFFSNSCLSFFLTPPVALGKDTCPKSLAGDRHIMSSTQGMIQQIRVFVYLSTCQCCYQHFTPCLKTSFHHQKEETAIFFPPVFNCSIYIYISGEIKFIQSATLVW